MNFNCRPAMTLIELLVSLAVVGLLISLALPIIHSVREAARANRCQNNLRQLGLAAMQFETTFVRLPGPWFNAPMDQREYTYDRGLFVWLLPYLEPFQEVALYDSSQNTFEFFNGMWTLAPSVFVCPSAPPPAELTAIARIFSGSGIENLASFTTDYIGNGGALGGTDEPIHQLDGPIGVQIGNFPLARAERLVDVTDGTSNTMLIWESIGGLSITRDSGTNIETSVDSNVDDSFTLIVIQDARIYEFQSSGHSSTKSYVKSWLGLRLGTVRSLDGLAVNVGNGLGEPCSRHPSGAYAVMLDGSIRLLSRYIDPRTAIALAAKSGA